MFEANHYPAAFLILSVCVLLLFFRSKKTTSSSASTEQTSPSQKESRFPFGFFPTLGMVSFSAAPYALDFGGPQTIVGFWLASLLCIVFFFFERRFFKSIARPLNEKNSNKTLNALACIFSAFFVLAMALFQSHELAAFEAGTFSIGHVSWTLSGIPILLLLFFLFSKTEGLKKILNFVLGLSTTALVVGAILWLSLNPEATQSAWVEVADGLNAAKNDTFGWIWGFLFAPWQYAFLRAAIAGDMPILRFGQSSKKGLVKLSLSLISMSVLSTLGVLVILSSTGTGGIRIDDPLLGLDRESLTEEQKLAARNSRPKFTPLERPHSRMASRSKLGQSIILPDDSPLKAGYRYPMVMRADPRGHKFGEVFHQHNVVLVPELEITEFVDTVIFRQKKEQLAAHPGLDRKILVDWDLAQLPSGRMAVQLSPVDPNVDFAKLERQMDGPYIVLDDYRFEGVVREAHNNKYEIGQHLAMLEYKEEKGKQRAGLDTVLSIGFRGPYFDQGADKGSPPRALLASETFQAPVGTYLELELRAPARGLELGWVDLAGALNLPPWDIAAQATHVLLRHKDGHHFDLRVPVRAEVDKGRVKLWSADPELIDFKNAARMQDFSGPFLLVPNQRFKVEVHSALLHPDPPLTPIAERNRKQGPLHERLTLVPIDSYDEKPAGAPQSVYKPHPEELIQAGMQGPFPTGGKSTQLAEAIKSRTAWALPLLLGILVVLVSQCLWNFFALGASSLAMVFGSGAQFAFALFFAVAFFAGPWLHNASINWLLEGSALALLALRLFSTHANDNR